MSSPTEGYPNHVFEGEVLDRLTTPDPNAETLSGIAANVRNIDNTLTDINEKTSETNRAVRGIGETVNEVNTSVIGVGDKVQEARDAVIDALNSNGQIIVDGMVSVGTEVKQGHVNVVSAINNMQETLDKLLPKPESKGPEVDFDAALDAYEISRRREAADIMTRNLHGELVRDADLLDGKLAKFAAKLFPGGEDEVGWNNLNPEDKKVILDNLNKRLKGRTTAERNIIEKELLYTHLDDVEPAQQPARTLEGVFKRAALGLGEALSPDHLGVIDRRGRKSDLLKLQPGDEGYSDPKSAKPPRKKILKILPGRRMNEKEYADLLANPAHRKRIDDKLNTKKISKPGGGQYPPFV